MHVDSLESRTLFSTAVRTSGKDLTGSTPTVDAPIAMKLTQRVTDFKVSSTGTLFVTGTSGDDVLNINVRNGKLDQTGFYQTEVVSSSSSAYRVVVPARFTQRIKRIVVVGLSGDDKITVHSDVPVTVNGSAGNDTINVFAPKYEINGGSGEDKEYGLITP